MAEQPPPRSIGLKPPPSSKKAEMKIERAGGGGRVLVLR
jgi:hypothetical protein